MGLKNLLEKQPESYRKRKSYNFHKLIGEGTFGAVKQATWTKPDGSKVEVAVKCINKKLVRGKPEVVLDEMNVLKNLSSSHIVQIYDWFESKDKYFLVFELVPGGELFGRIVDRHHFSEHDAARCVQAILNGVAYLHHKDICHRDLKPENLLLRTKGNQHLDDIVIADFGVARHLEPEGQVNKTLVGSPGYSAPELLTRSGYLGKPADIWSIGVVAYAVLSGTTPFSVTSEPQVMVDQQTSGKIDFSKPIWKDISAEAKDFITKCCVVDPEKRMTVDEALNHPWIQNECARSNHDIGEHVKKTLSRTTQDGGGTLLPTQRDLEAHEREQTPDSDDSGPGDQEVEALGQRVSAVRV